jgi:hypothetical protein
VAQLERGLRPPHRALDPQLQVTEIGSDLFAQCEVITGGLEINAVPVIPAKAGVQSLHWQ